MGTNLKLVATAALFIGTGTIYTTALTLGFTRARTFFRAGALITATATALT